MTFITRCPASSSLVVVLRVCSSPPPSRRARDEAATSLLGCRLQLQLKEPLPRPELDPRPPLQAVFAGTNALLVLLVPRLGRWRLCALRLRRA
jgi:hypothetical protein